VLQRQNFKDKTSKIRFKSSEKPHPCKNPKDRPPKFQINFKDLTSKTTETKTKKEKTG
jgi:hypothetical protein